MSIYDCISPTPKTPIYVRVRRRRRVLILSNSVMATDTIMVNAIRQ